MDFSIKHLKKREEITANTTHSPHDKNQRRKTEGPNPALPVGTKEIPRWIWIGTFHAVMTRFSIPGASTVDLVWVVALWRVRRDLVESSQALQHPHLDKEMKETRCNIF